MTDEIAGVEFAGLENDGLENDGLDVSKQQARLTEVNDGDEQSKDETVTLTAVITPYTLPTGVELEITFVYHIFYKYNSKQGIIYVFRFVLQTIACRTH